MASQIRHSTPLGCFIGSLTLFPAALALIAGYGMFRWLQLPEEKRIEQDVFHILVGALILGIVGTVVLVYFAYRIQQNSTYSEDPKDYKGPLTF